VCLMRRDHPRITGKLTRRQFLQESHDAVKTKGTGHWMMDKAIDDEGISRRISMQVPSFLALAEIVGHTDMLALAPIHLARTFCRDGMVRYSKVPFPIPSYSVRQYWHERFHRDPGNRWLREIAFQVLGEPATDSKRRPAV
ncbi:MAG: LysR substrate-binding domain-containing protein, partial [Lautropia sp.]